MAQRVLYICNTYYQVIVALQLSLTVHSGYEADLRLSDSSVGYREVAEGLRAAGVFGNVRTVETKELIRRSAARSSLAAKLLHCPLTRAERAGLRADVGYDAIVFFNPFPDVVPAVDSSAAAGGATRLFRMEEGLSSCSSAHSHQWGRRQYVLDAFRPLVGKKAVSRSVERFYCFIPELCDDDFPLETGRIPSLAETRSEIAPILSKAFGYRGFPYDENYIFFSSSLDADGTPTGETELVFRVAEAVGADNLLLKVHPRDARSVFRDAGLISMGQSSIPWEVVQLCEDLSGRCLLTCTSGSPLTITALLDDGTTGYYIKTASDEPAHLRNYEAAMAAVSPTIDRLHELGLCEGIRQVDFECFTQSVKGGFARDRARISEFGEKGR